MATVAQPRRCMGGGDNSGGDSAGGICRASLPAASGDMTLVEVIVQDYAGNEAIR